MKRFVGQMSHHAGRAAEDAVARAYQSGGLTVADQRWRGAGGEIDLIIRDGDELIFVEVKKARDFAQAAHRLSAKQIQRLYAAAEEYVGDEPLGALTPMRFDVALVNGQGRCHILENALVAH